MLDQWRKWQNGFDETQFLIYQENKLERVQDDMQSATIRFKAFYHL